MLRNCGTGDFKPDYIQDGIKRNALYKNAKREREGEYSERGEDAEGTCAEIGVPYLHFSHVKEVGV